MRRVDKSVTAANGKSASRGKSGRGCTDIDGAQEVPRSPSGSPRSIRVRPGVLWHRHEQMIASVPRSLHHPRRFVVAVCLLIAASILSTTMAVAQVPTEPVGISDVSYGLDGRIVLSAYASTGAQVDSDHVVMAIDGQELPATAVSRQPPPPAAVLIVVDAGASMSGIPLSAAKDAARGLIDRLGQNDEAALITFSDAARVVVPFTRDRTRLRSGIASIVATGSSGLYDAVQLSSRTVGQVPAGPHVVVLLSNAPLRKGDEVGGVSTTTRSQSLDLSSKSDARFFTFGLGSDPDSAYLSRLAEITDGSYKAVADVQALTGVVGALGDRVHNAFALETVIPPLPTGDHQASIRLTIGGTTATATRSFHVTNEGLFRIRTVQPTDPSGPIILALETPSRSDAIQFTGSLNGASMPFGSDRTATIDPWQLTPGQATIFVSATVGGRVVGSASQIVEIPALNPTLTARVEGKQGAGARLLVQGRVQGREGTLTAGARGQQLGRGPQPEIRVGIPPAAGDVLVQLLDSDGTVLQTQSVRVSASSPRNAVLLGTFLLLVTAGVALTILIRLSGHRRRARQATPRFEARGVGGDRSGIQFWGPDRAQTITVIDPRGATSAYELRGAPLVMGRIPVHLPGLVRDRLQRTK